MSRSEHVRTRFGWASAGQVRLVRLGRPGVLVSVVAVALATAAADSHDVVGAASLVGLALLLLGTALTLTPAFTRADAWVMLAVPLVDMTAIAALHLVAGDEAVAALLILPAIWLGRVAGVHGVVIAVTATLLLYSVPAYGSTGPHGGWSELVMHLAFAGLAAAAAVVVAAMWEQRLAQLSSALGELEDHRVHIQAIFDTVPVGMVELGPDGAYRSMNDLHWEFVALSHPDGHRGLAGEMGHLYAADNRTPLTRSQMASSRAAAGETFTDYVTWVGPHPEHRRAVSVSARQMLRSDGSRSGAVIAYHDITELMHALHVKDDFVASVSHELRTPLTSIIGYLDLARDDDSALPADVAHFLAVASRNADRLLVLVSDLLTAARAEAVAIQLHRTATDLPSLVRLGIDEAAEQSEQALVTLRSRLDPLPPAMVDPDRIRQVVENLLTNAVKYTGPGGTVTISLMLAGSEIVLEVADTGSGISTSDQRHVFEKFFRGENAASSTVPGIGMGLAICQQIVEAHAGRIEVSSRVGAGTTMRVFLPLDLETPPQAGVRPDEVAV